MQTNPSKMSHIIILNLKGKCTHYLDKLMLSLGDKENLCVLTVTAMIFPSPEEFLITNS